MKFAGRSALISGGAGGLGGTTARRLAELGTAVVIFEPEGDRPYEVAREIGRIAMAVVRTKATKLPCLKP